VAPEPVGRHRRETVGSPKPENRKVLTQCGGAGVGAV